MSNHLNPHMLQRMCPKSKFTTNPARNDKRPSTDSTSVLNTLDQGQTLLLDEPELKGAKDELQMSIEFKRVAKEVEDYVKSRRHSLEEKMFEKYYVMRIEQSRRFIDLIRKINKSWDDFVEYLKSIGSQSYSGDGDCTVYSLTNSTSLTVQSQVTNNSK